MWTSPSHEEEAAFPQLTVCVENIPIARTLHQHCITDAGDAGEIRGCTSQTLQDTRNVSWVRDAAEIRGTSSTRLLHGA